MNRPKPFSKPMGERHHFSPDNIRTFSVAQPATLMPFLLQAMAPARRTPVKNLLRIGSVAVNDTPTTRFDHPIKPGDKVSVNLTRPFVVFSHRRLKLVFEDDDIIVVEKGYGLLSVGTGKNKEETAYDILKDYLKRKNPANKIFVVHRLDRDTSGLMMFAKNPRAKEAMQHNWNNMVLSRKYVAVVEGRPQPAEGTVRSYLLQNSALEVYSVQEPREGARLAVTRYKTLKTAGGYSWVELELDTGRKNQIRVHMRDMGTPIAGDRKYGARTGPFKRMALHARTLRFVHPTTRKAMAFESRPPF